MKLTLRIILAIGLFISIAGAVQAQNQKIGHLNVSVVMSEMPEYKAAEEKVAALNLQLQNEMQKLTVNLQTKYQEYVQQQQMLTDVIKQSRENELEALQQQLQQFQVDAEQEIQRTIQQLEGPIITKVTAAIEAVAKEKGYAYILDIGQGTIPYFAGGDDVSSLVKAKL